MLKLIVSVPVSPAIHSPGVAPLAVLVFAAVIASLSVQTPSSARVSALELTVMVWAAEAGRAVNTKRPKKDTAIASFNFCIILISVTPITFYEE
jgi:hypothetical protein